MKILKPVLLCLCAVSLAVSVGCAKKTSEQPSASQPASEATASQ